LYALAEVMTDFASFQLEHKASRQEEIQKYKEFQQSLDKRPTSTASGRGKKEPSGTTTHSNGGKKRTRTTTKTKGSSGLKLKSKLNPNAREFRPGQVRGTIRTNQVFALLFEIFLSSSIFLNVA
jgi:hypothetical protein